MAATRGTVAPVAPRPRAAVILPTVAVLGLAIATYLTITKLAGGSPVCGPLQGCETVDASPYSRILGIPTALFGMAYSAVLLALALRWNRSGDHRLIQGAYLLGLAGVLVEAYLVYLQVAVIGAVCVWCAAYGLTVLGGFVAAVSLVRGSAGRARGTAGRDPG